jgi:hypothetical protein
LRILQLTFHLRFNYKKKYFVFLTNTKKKSRPSKKTGRKRKVKEKKKIKRNEKEEKKRK